MKNKVCGIISLTLVVLQVVLIMASWIVTSAMPELSMRSLLSPEGVRWLFGHFIENMSSPLLVDIILLSVAFGAVSFSGLVDSVVAMAHCRKKRYFERVGLWVVVGEILTVVIVVVLLTCVPHAILLSVTGHLFPSNFSQSLIPIISITLLACSISFGLVSGRLSSLSQCFEAMTYGLVRFAWVLPIYVFFMELLRSIQFVFYV